MKTFTLILFVLFASVIVILKLITSPGSVNTSETSHGRKMNGTEAPIYQYNKEAYYQQNTNEKIDDLKLTAFAKAFVDVQSYMHKAGNKANYSETSRIVQRHGLSVKNYTKIASRMNNNSDFQNKVQKKINEVN